MTVKAKHIEMEMSSKLENMVLSMLKFLQMMLIDKIARRWCFLVKETTLSKKKEEKATHTEGLAHLVSGGTSF